MAKKHKRLPASLSGLKQSRDSTYGAWKKVRLFTKKSGAKVYLVPRRTHISKRASRKSRRYSKSAESRGTA